MAAVPAETVAGTRASLGQGSPGLCLNKGSVFVFTVQAWESGLRSCAISLC
ncbi:hypothetical protein Nmel_016669 [Mimus melanotis]